HLGRGWFPALQLFQIGDQIGASLGLSPDGVGDPGAHRGGTAGADLRLGQTRQVVVKADGNPTHIGRLRAYARPSNGSSVLLRLISAPVCERPDVREQTRSRRVQPHMTRSCAAATLRGLAAL